jgi:phosphate transport system protein
MGESTETRGAGPLTGSGGESRLGRMRELVLSMGDEVDRAIARATTGLMSRDVELCAAVIREDARVNALLLEVREQSLSALAESPEAPELREILGLLHMANELERMADHCANIAGIGRELADLPPLGSYVDLPQLAAACGEQVRNMLAALIARDAERARAVAARDDRVNRIYHRVIDDLVQLMTEKGDLVYRGTRLVMASQNYERLGDRVTNLAEDLIFLETGRIEDLG